MSIIVLYSVYVRERIIAYKMIILFYSIISVLFVQVFQEIRLFQDVLRNLMKLVCFGGDKLSTSRYYG